MADYTVKNGKSLRYGYTTGSTATAASSAAAIMLLTGTLLDKVFITLPSGEDVEFTIYDPKLEKDGSLSCYTIKDGGDDPDVTHGAKIYARVEKIDSPEIIIDGGNGVGRVTAKGLQCKVGEAAINPVPRKMIDFNLRNIGRSYNYSGGFKVIISVENGEEIAKKTYNGRLGIEGGISILGTTGVVEPMSEKALIDTVKVMVDKQYTLDEDLILISPGNYGEKFCKDSLGLNIDKAVKVSNFIGEALDYIRYKGFKRILFIGHTGKLIKTGAGIMNTHSYYADGRMEIIGVHSAINGADSTTVKEIMGCITTDEALDLIKNKPYYENVKKDILDKVMYHLNYRLKNEIEIGVMMFTTDESHIIKSDNADRLIEDYRIKNESMEDKL